MTRSACALLSLALLGCPGETVAPPPPPLPPQVFLTVVENNVIGDTIRGRVNVSGCKNVAQVQLLQNDAFLYDVQYTKSPTEFALPAGLFSALYSRLGIAASLTLRAKVVCDDARTNTSQPVGVRFFPIASRVAKAGEQVVPDFFVAEGGVGSTPTSFLGCVGTRIGTAIARVDTQGNVLGYNDQLPFGCSANTQISDRSLITGMRWVFEPLAGAYALDGSLNVHKVVRSQQARRIGVGKGGSAVIWLDESGTRNRIQFAKPQVETSNDWDVPFYGIMNSTPVIDDGAGQAVWVSSFQYVQSPPHADQVVYKHSIPQRGALLNGIAGGAAPVIVKQSLAEINIPITPEASLSADGSLYVVPLLSADVTGFIRTTVIACATTGGLCETQEIRRWTSPTVDGVLRNVVSFSAGNYYAAMGPYAVYFLNAQVGTIANLGEQPLRPEGSNIVFGGQPGLGTDFYVLSGPVLGDGVASWPTEIIATDNPGSGELWRMQSGSGESPTAANWITIDDNAQPWVRVGVDLVKPLPNTEYRNARGPTPVP